MINKFPVKEIIRSIKNENISKKKQFMIIVLN